MHALPLVFIVLFLNACGEDAPKNPPFQSFENTLERDTVALAIEKDLELKFANDLFNSPNGQLEVMRVELDHDPATQEAFVKVTSKATCSNQGDCLINLMHIPADASKPWQTTYSAYGQDVHITNEKIDGHLSFYITHSLSAYHRHMWVKDDDFGSHYMLDTNEATTTYPGWQKQEQAK
ncbi:MAG: hypothetical protein WAX89_02345 [Alphaproteobacteria bacterium]